VLRGRFLTIQAYLKKQEKSQINNQTLHLKQLAKEEMRDTRVRRRKEILKVRAEINAKEKKETIAKINKAKSWFFEKINKIDKPLARLCLLVGAFNPFTFKVITEKYYPIAIYFIVLGSSLYTLSVFPV